MDYNNLSERCSMCGLGCNADKQCMPKGSDNPYIYFVGEAPGPEENKAGIPFIGRSGKMLHDVADEVGLNEDSCRFFNVCRCFPVVENADGSKGFRAPSKDEMNICKEFLFADIRSHKPKVIVTVGSTATRALLPNIGVGISTSRGKVYKFEDIYVIPTYHPSYILRNARNPKYLDDLKRDVKLARDISVNESIAGSYVNNLEDNRSKTVLCKSFKEFYEFCTDYIDDCNSIGFDVETNAEEVHSANHEIVGFSIAPNERIGCYVPLKSLDFVMSRADRRFIENKMKQILTSRNVIVYNCQHEYPATLNWIDTEISDIDDVFVMVKLMMGNADKYQGNGGLKAQSVEYLKYNDWSEDLDKYFTYLTTFSKPGIREEMESLLSNYYSGDDLISIMSTVEDIALNVVSKLPAGKVISYEYVPHKLIGRYGSIDSSVLFELKKYYEDWMDREGSELGINLHQGYKYWMMHHYCGFILERNGAFWNDKKATEIENWCNTGMHDSLRNMIASPLADPYIKSKMHDKFNIYLRDNYMTEILGQDYTPVRMYKSTMSVRCNNPDAERRLRSMSILPDKKGLYKIEMGNFRTLANGFLSSNPGMYETWYRSYIDKYVSEDHTVDEYKTIINPNATSSDFKQFVSSLLITDEIRVAKLYSELVKILEDPDFDIDYYKDFYIGDKKDNTVKFNREFNISVYKANNPRCEFRSTYDSNVLEFVHKLNTDERLSVSRKFYMFSKYISKNPAAFQAYKIKRAHTSAVGFELSSLDSESMNEIYELYLMCNIDVEDSSTWNDRFDWLVNYKRFKKFSKLISTYINGKVGRNNVYYVDRESYGNGDEFTRRGDLYSKDTKDGQMMMVQTQFRVNMADTGRWQCGWHNIPAGEAIKSIYTSRFKGGCIAMPDGSQMEVRTLAAECRDENLFKAFKDKLDIHRFFASKIYQVPYDEVQSWQRGLAKNAVFGMIYGESEKAFADIYLNGDLTQAKKVFDDMFLGFPKIKEYIERAQSQYKKYEKVTTITQRYIKLNDPRIDPNTMLRRSQNYPIQAAAADIAGIIMYKIVEYMRENNLKSKIIMYVHDSIEIDMHPDEVFKLADKIDYLFNVFPVEEWGVPVACDFPLGPSMGQECAMEEMVHDDDYNDVTIVLKGFVDDIDELVDIWKDEYSLVEYIDLDEYKEKDKEEYIPLSKMFLPKKAVVSMNAGNTRYKGSRKIHVVRRMQLCQD